MLTRADFLSLNFVAKEDFTGSYKGIRFMLHKEVAEEEKKLKVYCKVRSLCGLTPLPPSPGSPAPRRSAWPGWCVP